MKIINKLKKTFKSIILHNIVNLVISNISEHPSNYVLL